jgi:hypothetical protein
VAVALALLPFAVVGTAEDVAHAALPFPQAALPLAFVAVAVGEQEDAGAFRLALDVLPFVLPLRAAEITLSMRPASGKGADVAGAVIPLQRCLSLDFAAHQRAFQLVPVALGGAP